MSHGYRPKNFRGLNKKKLVVAALVVGAIGIVLLLVIVVVIAMVIGALSGQADSSIGKSISDLISTLWNGALDFVTALWKQIIANPLQFLMGGGN